MSIIRPATPGFVVTLTAAVLLAVVVFCVPYLKSVFFLKAAFTQDNITGWITLGTLGYCFNDGTNTNCSKPSIGYEFGAQLAVNVYCGVCHECSPMLRDRP